MSKFPLVCIVLVSGLLGPPLLGVAAPSSYDRQWAQFDDDPEHLWNRVYRALYERGEGVNRRYCDDELMAFFQGHELCQMDTVTRAKAVAVLDEFIAKDGDRLIEDPVVRAVFQRSLWATLDRSLEHDDSLALHQRLVAVMRRIALSRREIEQLPDTYRAAVQAGRYATSYSEKTRGQPYLPSDLFESDGPWVLLGSSANPLWPTSTMHTVKFQGRATFYVLLRLPAGREATLAFVESLRREARSPDEFYRKLEARTKAGELELPVGTQLALVRAMMTVANSPYPYTTPIVETVQIRVLVPHDTSPQHSGDQTPDEDVYVFRLDQQALRRNVADGLRPVSAQDQVFETWIKPADNPTTERVAQPKNVVDQCAVCHGSRHLYAFQSFGRAAQVGEPLPELVPTNIEHTRYTAQHWKTGHRTWGYLLALWRHN